MRKDWSFRRHLEWCAEYGNLTVSDLARWFERPDPTVRGWYWRDVQPTGAPHDTKDIMQRLDLLMVLVRKRVGFPLPRISQRKRKVHLNRMIQELKEDGRIDVAVYNPQTDDLRN